MTTVVVRSPKDGGDSSWIPTDVLQDPDLSARARGLMGFLLSFPDDTDFTLTKIRQHRPKDGKQAIRTAVAELEAAGYVAWRYVRTSQPNGGHLRRRVLDVYDMRGTAPPSAPLPGNPASTLKAGDTCAGFFRGGAQAPPRGFAVYRLYGHDDRLLYVGRTGQPRQRMRAHLNTRGPELLARWEMVGCATHDEMCRLEVELIDRLQPPLNRVADLAGRTP